MSNEPLSKEDLLALGAASEALNYVNTPPAPVTGPITFFFALVKLGVQLAVLAALLVALFIGIPFLVTLI
jgi:hypothetical protein